MHTTEITLSPESVRALAAELLRLQAETVREAEQISLADAVREFGGSRRTWQDWKRSGAMRCTVSASGRVTLARSEARRLHALKRRHYKAAS